MNLKLNKSPTYDKITPTSAISAICVTLGDSLSSFKNESNNSSAADNEINYQFRSNNNTSLI